MLNFWWNGFDFRSRITWIRICYFFFHSNRSNIFNNLNLHLSKPNLDCWKYLNNCDFNFLIFFGEIQQIWFRSTNSKMQNILYGSSNFFFIKFIHDEYSYFIRNKSAMIQRNCRNYVILNSTFHLFSYSWIIKKNSCIPKKNKYKFEIIETLQFLY